jgi:TetR/AcrR family transcriptional repressor of nem operon
MSWSPERKANSREAIVLAAAQLFTQLGFDAVGIDQIMQQAGMTRGAFYAHFKSKNELYAEAVLLAGRRLLLASHPGLSFEEFVAVYLAPNQLSPDELSCPLACLVTDIAQRDDAIKKVYEQLFSGFVKHLRQLNPRLNRELAMSCAASLIGAQAVAKALNAPAMAKELLASAQKDIVARYAAA